MKQGMELIRPKLIEEKVEPLGRAAIGTVKGDLHDIGKNLVAMMLEGAGFEVIDLGIDVPPEKFIDAVKTRGAQVICMSALLTTTMPSMQTTVEAVKEAGLMGKVRVMIGGAPVTQAYADQIGANGYAPDAASAAEKAKELVAAMS
jgi:5-methyltetrahydrofolate--homocysteine methyltransferase